MRTCTKCDKPYDESFFSWKIKDKLRSSVCKDCHRQYRKEHYQLNREKYIAKARRWDSETGYKVYGRYGLSKDQYEELVTKHDGKCWICLENDGVCIDHDHNCCKNKNGGSCGKCVRGLLCDPCNKVLGFSRDRVDILHRAAIYLS
jgi:hypothetical protein